MIAAPRRESTDIQWQPACYAEQPPMKTGKSQFKSYPAAAPAKRSALLFVHGAYVNASCWTVNFIPFFQRHGYDCFTIDLAGHGDSEDRKRIDELGLADYVADVARAHRAIDRPCVIVGHSMGARVLERFLETGQAEAAMFLSPIPTTGTAGSAIQLGLRYPDFFDSLNAAVNGKITQKTSELMTKIFFSPDVSPAEALKFLPMLCPESQQAVSEMALPDLRLSVRRQKLPALVIGGSEDAVFPASMLHFMASSWRADLYRAAGAGHMLMLDPQWESVANHMLGWMKRRVPA